MKVPEIEDIKENETKDISVQPPEARPVRKLPAKTFWIIALIVTYLLGIGSGYGLSGMNQKKRPGTRKV